MVPLLSASLAVAAVLPLALAQECPPGFTRFACNETDAELVADDLEWAPSASIATTLNWEACPTANDADLECAVLRVPEDYTALWTLKFIDLPLVRHPSSKAGAKSILVNYGGPGSSGIKVFANGDGKNLARNYGDEYHWMSFDPRGTGLTTPYNCPKTKSTLTNTLNTLAGRRQSAQDAINQGDACNKAPYARAGALVGTAFVARDVRRIFRALGEDNLIRYFGISYGTLLGATISAMFPKEIERIVLDANVDPDSHYSGLREDRGTDTDKALLNFFTLCAAAGPTNCALAKTGQTGTQLRTTFNQFLDKIKNKKYEAGGKRVTYSSVKSQVLKALYAPTKWTDFARTLNGYYSATEVKKRDVELENEYERRAAFKPQSATEPDLAITAVRCADWKWTNIGVSVSHTASALESWLPRFTAVSRFAGDIFVTHPINCMSWKIKAKERYAGKWKNIRTKTPALLINGAYDPVTPVAAARQLSGALVGSRLLIHNGAGHGCRQNPSTFVVNSIKDYLKTGVLPDVSITRAPNRANLFVPAMTALTAGADDIPPPVIYDDLDNTDDTTDPRGAMWLFPPKLKARLEPYTLPSLHARQTNSTTFNGTLPSGCVEIPETCPGEKFDLPAEKPPGQDEPLIDDPTTVVYSDLTTTTRVPCTRAVCTGSAGVPDVYSTVTTTISCAGCPTPSTVVLTTKIEGTAGAPPVQTGGGGSGQTPGGTPAQSTGPSGAGGSGPGQSGSANPTTVRAGANTVLRPAGAMMGVLLGLGGYLVL